MRRVGTLGLAMAVVMLIGVVTYPYYGASGPTAQAQSVSPPAADRSVDTAVSHLASFIESTGSERPKTAVVHSARRSAALDAAGSSRVASGGDPSALVIVFQGSFGALRGRPVGDSASDPTHARVAVFIVDASSGEVLDIGLIPEMPEGLLRLGAGLEVVVR